MTGFFEANAYKISEWVWLRPCREDTLTVRLVGNSYFLLILAGLALAAGLLFPPVIPFFDTGLILYLSE